MLPEKLRVCYHRNHHLCISLAMADIRYLLLPSLIDYELPKSWLIIQSHLMKREIVIFSLLFFDLRKRPQFVIGGIEPLMLFGVFAAPSVIEPNVESHIDELEPDRVFTVEDPTAC